jgi:Ca-activated chloride channel family protein
MFSMIEQKLGAARLFTVGIGSAPNSLFMRKAAEAGRGSYTFISALHEVREKMDALFKKLEHPQVTDIEVQWPSGVLVDAYPSTVPDLYLGEPITVKARASGTFRPVRISGNAVSGGWATELALGEMAGSEGVAALWARARIAELMDIERRGGNSEEVRADILETALMHHLVSKYTSLIAVDKTPVRPAGDPLSSEQVPNLMPYGQTTNAIFGFPATATDAPALRIMGLAWLLCALGLLAIIRGRLARTGFLAAGSGCVHSRESLACPGADAACLGPDGRRGRPCCPVALGRYLAGGAFDCEGAWR